jgi:hypothetical protein
MTGTATSIPAPTSSFVGRRGELAQVRRLYEYSRLVPLVGVGGVGKTRSALPAAQDMSRAYCGGVWLTDFTAVSSPDLVAPTVAAAPGVRDQSARSAVDTVIAFLWTRHALLVIDNCEHLVGPIAELVDRLLRGAPQLRVLTTSREALRAPGEHEMVVLPLTTPDPHTRGAAESVDLLVDRARAVGVVVSSSAPAVGELCRRLDGIPLAIERAAARLPTLGAISDILLRLGRDSLRVPNDGSAGSAPRHQHTMVEMLDWSNDGGDDGAGSAVHRPAGHLQWPRPLPPVGAIARVRPDEAPRQRYGNNSPWPAGVRASRSIGVKPSAKQPYRAPTMVNHHLTARHNAEQDTMDSHSHPVGRFLPLDNSVFGLPGEADTTPFAALIAAAVDDCQECYDIQVTAVAQQPLLVAHLTTYAHLCILGPRAERVGKPVHELAADYCVTTRSMFVMIEACQLHNVLVVAQRAEHHERLAAATEMAELYIDALAAGELTP